MKSYDYDLFVIGGGSGGIRAARMSAALGARVAIAEDCHLGGTCVNVGCVPKKLFFYAAQVAEEFRIASSFGWSIDNPKFNWRTLLDNKNQEIGRLNGVYQKILKDNDIDLVDGRAVLTGPQTIKINNRIVHSEKILVATGGYPAFPDIPGKEYVISSNEAFHLDKLPERIAIVGGGYIAVEFAGIFHGMGVDTTLIYRGPLFLRGFDIDIREKLAEQMHHQGIHLLFNQNPVRIVNQGKALLTYFADDNHQIFDTVMYAIGRNPNTVNLGLEAIGVQLSNNGAVKVNDFYQTNIPSIYAIGDVTDRINLTPIALAEGTSLAQSLFGKVDAPVDYSIVPTAVFSRPSIGMVGLTEDEARARYPNVAIYLSNFKPMKWSFIPSDERSLMKIIVDKDSDQVVGVHVLGAEAGEIIQGIAIALRAGATKSIFDSTIGIHPTMAEELVNMRDQTPPL